MSSTASSPDLLLSQQSAVHQGSDINRPPRLIQIAFERRRLENEYKRGQGLGERQDHEIQTRKWAHEAQMERERRAHEAEMTKLRMQHEAGMEMRRQRKIVNELLMKTEREQKARDLEVKRQLKRFEARLELLRKRVANLAHLVRGSDSESDDDSMTLDL